MQMNEVLPQTFYLIFCVYVCEHLYTRAYMCISGGNCGNWFSISTMWISRTKDSCLVASPFISWAISLVQMSYTDGETEALKKNNLQCVTNYEVWLDEE